MKYDVAVDTLTDYIAKNPEIKNKQAYEIYNLWAMTTGIVIRDISVAQWIIDYINDLKLISQKILEETKLT